MKATTEFTQFMTKPGKKFNVPEWIKDHRDFFNWWKRHRHSGYWEKEGKAQWGETPWVAYTCTRYRMEFSVDSGSSFTPTPVHGLPIEYTADEIERWAKEQRDFEKCGNERVAIADSRAIAALSEKFKSATKEAIGRRTPFSQDEIHQQINTLNRKAA